MGIDWKLIIELYPNAVKKVNEMLFEWQGDPQITSEGIIDEDGNIYIPEMMLFELEDLGVDITSRYPTTTPEDYANFYINAFKELN